MRLMEKHSARPKNKGRFLRLPAAGVEPHEPVATDHVNPRAPKLNLERVEHITGRPPSCGHRGPQSSCPMGRVEQGQAAWQDEPPRNRHIHQS